MSTGRYVYAVSRGLPGDAVSEVRGIEDAPVELVEQGGLVALVSTVPLDAYGEEGLRRNLEDLEWLENVVRRHDDVVHAAASRAPTAPMRLATICFDDEAVRDRIRTWQVDLTHVLERVEGCAEWSVKVLQPTAEKAEEKEDAPVSGADYLRRKKESAEQRSQGEAAGSRAADGIHGALSALSRASRQLPAQDPRLSGLEGTMLLNAAYLVPDDAVGDFEAVLADLTGQHPDVVLDARGPWPPYSFAMLDQP